MSGRAPARRLVGLGVAGVLLAACSSSPSTPTSSVRAVVTAPPQSLAPTPSPTPAPPPPPPGVIVLVLENHSYESVIGSSSAPALNALAARYGLATRSYAFGHPSLPNYLDLVGGSSFGITSDCTSCNVEGTTIADQLVSSGHTWAAYSEDMPKACYNGAFAGGDNYAKKHNPFMYFTHLRDDPSLCSQDQPFSAFYPALDAATLPTYSLVVPNQCNDGHNCSLAHSDTWVRDFSNRVTGSAWFKAGGVLLITYDEGVGGAGCCVAASGGHIATWVISAATKPGVRLDTPVSHAGLLRTVEMLYGLSYLGEANCVCSGNLLPLLGR
jgi:acid phosphatase